MVLTLPFSVLPNISSGSTPTSPLQATYTQPAYASNLGSWAGCRDWSIVFEDQALDMSSPLWPKQEFDSPTPKQIAGPIAIPIYSFVNSFVSLGPALVSGLHDFLGVHLGLLFTTARSCAGMTLRLLFRLAESVL